MATITETVTTTEEVEYTTPVYRKIGVYWFIKIYSTTKMVEVNTLEDFESVEIVSFPSSLVKSISQTTASDETEFTAAYDAAVAAIDAVVNPA